MVKANYRYQPVPKILHHCKCGTEFYSRKNAELCEACKKKHAHDYFQLWYKKNKERRALERKAPKTKKPCVVCGVPVLGNAYKKKCDKCLQARRSAYAKKWYLKHKGEK
jgi:hypothetical protein